MTSKRVFQPIDVVREIYGEQFPLINRYVDILATAGINWGLLGPREANRLWDRHIINSVALSQFIAAGRSVVDVGSGAGLPGIPLTVLRPDVRMTLLEPLLRRSKFLRLALTELDLADRVEVVRARAEDHHQSYDVVVSRALAPLDRLIGWCSPLRAAGGVILALKGDSAGEEITAATRQLELARLNAEVLRVQAHPEVEPATVVRLTARN